MRLRVLMLGAGARASDYTVSRGKACRDQDGGQVGRVRS
jgi:hypothetical protein